MHQALVVDTDVLGRNTLRTALERLGYVVTTTASVLDADTLAGAKAFDLVAIDGSQPGEAPMNLARRLRQRGWRGVLVYTARLLPDERLRELTRDLLAAAVIMKPTLVEEIELRLASMAPPDADPSRVLDAYVPTAWNGALRRARTEYGKNLGVWVSGLVHELSTARNGDLTRLAEAHRLATEIHADTARFLFAGLSELAGALAELIQEMIDGRVPTTPTSASWNDVDDLLGVLSLAVPSADRSLATVDSAQVDAYDKAVLVVTHDVDQLIGIAAIAERREIGMLSARNLKEALRVALRRRIDGALIAHDLPEGGVPLLVEWLQRQPGLADLPIALVVPPGSASDPDMATLARARGARFVVESPVTERRFLSAVERLARGRLQRKPRVLLLDGDRETAAGLKRLLGANAMDLGWASSAADVRGMLYAQRPDAVIVDVLVPPAGGLDVCRQIRASSRWSQLPVLCVASQPTAKVRAACFRAGADAVLPKPVPEEETLPRLASMIERSRAVRELDPVTNTLHRRAFLAALEGLVASDLEIALGLVDVVGFRRINLEAGHEAGDRVLAGVATAIADVTVDRGVIGRWGDDELVVAIAGETRTGMTNLLTLAAQKIRTLKVDGRDGARVPVTVQVAASSTSRTGRVAEALVDDAEVALRAAKGAGA